MRVSGTCVSRDVPCALTLPSDDTFFCFCKQMYAGGEAREGGGLLRIT